MKNWPARIVFTLTLVSSAYLTAASRNYGQLELSIGRSTLFKSYLNENQSHSTGVNPAICFFYLTPNHWRLGWSLKLANYQLKTLKSSKLAALSIGHRVNYLLRVYHPLYLTLGIRTQYDFISKDISAAFDAHPDITSSINVGIELGLETTLYQDFRGHIKLYYWRHTSSSQFSGLDIETGLSYQF